MTNMDDLASPHSPGPFEARYLAFLETITHLRSSLHRYCTRMTGSVMDGEDIVQEALFQVLLRKCESKQLACFMIFTECPIHRGLATLGHAEKGFLSEKCN